MRKQLLQLSCLAILIAGSCKKSSGDNEPGTPPAPPSSGLKAPPASLGLDVFYKKYIDAEGIPVISSEKVNDEALLRAREIVIYMVKMIPDAKAKMIQNKLRVGIIGITEKPTQMPEYRDLYTAFPGTDWDTRARGYGATIQRPLTTNCEENMRCLTNDMYKGEDLLTHEFSHAIHELGLRFTVPSFDADLQAAFNNAVSKNLWANTYARTNVNEYWAEGVQDWFNCNIEAIPTNGVHNSINTRVELKTYDVTLYNLIKKYFLDEERKHGCY